MNGIHVLVVEPVSSKMNVPAADVGTELALSEAYQSTPADVMVQWTIGKIGNSELVGLDRFGFGWLPIGYWIGWIEASS